MKAHNFLKLLFFSLFLLPTVPDCKGKPRGNDAQTRNISLPEPRLVGDMTLEEALLLRRSVRSYSGEPVALEELSQLVWAAQGITSEEGFRTAPSAGALYPLEIYVVAGNVSGLKEGLYRYSPATHTFTTIREGDFRQALSKAALAQRQVEEAAANIVIAAVFERTMETYGERGRRYVHMEAGHVAQNICLQAQSLNLGVCPNGAFEDDEVKRVLLLPENEDPLYILSLGGVR